MAWTKTVRSPTRGHMQCLACMQYSCKLLYSAVPIALLKYAMCQNIGHEQCPYLFSAVDIGSHMGNSIAGLCGAGGAKFDGLPPHGVLLRAALLQRDHPAEHDVHASQNLKTSWLACERLLPPQRKQLPESSCLSQSLRWMAASTLQQQSTLHAVIKLWHR